MNELVEEIRRYVLTLDGSVASATTKDLLNSAACRILELEGNNPSDKRTQIEEFASCDFCGNRLERHKQCLGCGKDLCPSCGHWWFQDPFTEDDNGDYPPLVCNRCDKLAKKSSSVAVEIKNDAYERVEAIKQRWKRECSDG